MLPFVNMTFIYLQAICKWDQGFFLVFYGDMYRHMLSNSFIVWDISLTDNGNKHMFSWLKCANDWGTLVDCLLKYWLNW